ncbi:hypothetical protein, partial [Salmonella enterica]|uniref:hypothetical protein n=1 Tax=Salmonella enterica TaxID=28901 RepID=UPI001C3EB2A3
LQWQPFAAILDVLRFKLAPVRLPGLYQSTCGGFLYPATYAAGDQAPQHCASPGKPGLLLILRQNPRPGTALTYNLRDASQTIIFICQNTFSISEAGSQPLNSENYASS